ncbi:MAG: Phosphomannomutase [Candidatus Jorgensenbacteria bacterium GW2011_GWA1_48_13]|uniref:Phosphomannomutase n=2 Tax=Candidatus Joergenseniibacteriota TaxID=1752739 RepID=A0A0G1YJU5_9BACT|nr:MAG: Phosphomannomutase [Candidatus Jorgensenbacteria bacterium GW2011_GWA1_48_13]KKU99387.1 MAG: Phosphomannomutase [Candidatus Jorgensenbacteria bacterium GW2011_GWC1_48_8]KKW15272.1 MAG: Phosphomannomutase [Candidatus Jorgensenbacteria bacterium GW2011_GWB1_50_10]
MNQDIFKAYDIRGIYPSEISEKTAFEIGLGLGRFFGKGRVVVARDGRRGSPKLYQAVIKGLKTNNLQLITVGLATTPMFYFLVAKLGCRGGIIVTASHNPKEYNGFKVVGKNAEMISGKEVLRIMNKEL